MNKNQNFHQILEQAKQQRAEVIGSTVRKQTLPIAVLVAVLAVFTWSTPETQTSSQSGTVLAEVTSVAR